MHLLHFKRFLLKDVHNVIMHINITIGQTKLKADWRAVDSHIKRTDEFILFAYYSSQQTKQISPFIFWEKLADHKLLSRLTDL